MPPPFGEYAIRRPRFSLFGIASVFVWLLSFRQVNVRMPSLVWVTSYDLMIDLFDPETR